MKTGFERATVIVSTYNRPDALDAVLRAFDRQVDRGFEVVVADDGSDERTRQVIDAARARVGYDLEHAWQEDRGFRLSRSRNLAVGRARGDYLIFLDGDCVPRPGFIDRHRGLAEEGWFVRGTRAALSQDFTRRILEDAVPVEQWSLGRWIWATARRDLKDPSPLLYWPGQGLRKRTPEKWRGAQTCNLGVSAAGFRAVDGFDEAYEGWGMDDADLAVRLIRSGVRRKEGKFSTAVLHLWHPDNDRATLEANEALFRDTLEGDRERARIGLSSHTGPGTDASGPGTL